MKLLRLNYIKGEHPHPLDGFDQIFHSVNDLNSTSPICLAGINGSGKSKLLEILTDIFFYLNNYYDSFNPNNDKTKIQFELEYLLEGKKNIHVKISQIKESGVPVFEIIQGGKTKIIADKSIAENYLPKNIVGYTSGDNETLSKRFEETYIQYSENVTDLVKNPKEGVVPDTRLVFLDYKVNSYVFIANSIYRSKSELVIITDKIPELDSLESFRITIQESPKYKNKEVPIRLSAELGNYIAALKKCATTFFYEDKSQKTILDFYLNEATKKLFRKYFKSAFHLYKSLYKLDLLNDILLRRDKKGTLLQAEYPNQKHIFPELSVEDKVFCIENIRVNLTTTENDIDYFDLSDGEHQFIHVLGSLLMIDAPDTLFLLDEPETHFNPQWRSKFISTLDEIKHSSNQDFFITTHSPFLLGDCKMEHVLIFEDGKAKNPTVQTYGLSMERLLKEAFGVVPPMSEKSLVDIKKLQKSKSYKNIESRLDDFGESIEKFYLFNRLAELKRSPKKKARRRKKR